MPGHAQPHIHRDGPLGFGVLTTTDSRTADEDASGAILRAAIEKAGHHVVRSGLCANSIPAIQDAVRGWISTQEVEAIVTSGGTGFSPRDVTIDALEQMGGRKVDGFGERFRTLSYDQVGILSLMSRSALYLVDRRPVFALPGSPKACQLAIEQIILPFAPHLVSELRKV